MPALLRAAACRLVISSRSVITRCYTVQAALIERKAGQEMNVAVLVSAPLRAIDALAADRGGISHPADAIDAAHVDPGASASSGAYHAGRCGSHLPRG